MVPDDTSSGGDAGSDAANDARNRRGTDDDTADDRDGPNAGSDGLLSPGDDAPAEAADLLLYGVLGGVVGSVLSFVPFATVLGGAAAGYLCGGTPADGLKTGAVAGLVMTLPFVAMVAFALFLFGFAGAPAEFGILAFLVIGVGAAYTLGSGVIGGYLGHYLRGRL
ncbi:DUF5518 domain-containing protein [Halorubrum yunnanense]|uniref:DUF5518 domain-containing protein n=1 Tax=Halorubrum yunnanense TaxID=1526162 RepID=A0ABD5YBT4_9EURY|nr:DUF5518 domain-containing protein [Halorubrum yunnanense]